MLLSAATATMPNSVLWTVDLFGRVYTLSTAGQYWELCKDPQLEFKRVSAATQCCWGIACDNQIYVYVCSSDLPIRHREEAYENQVGSVCGWRGRWVCQEVEPPAPGFWPPPTFVFLHFTYSPNCGGSRVFWVRDPVVSYKGRLARPAQWGAPGSIQEPRTGPCLPQPVPWGPMSCSRFSVLRARLLYWLLMKSTGVTDP